MMHLLSNSQATSRVHFRGAAQRPASAKDKGDSEPPLQKVARLVGQRHPELLSEMLWQTADRFDKQPADTHAADFLTLLKYGADPTLVTSPDGEPLLSWTIQQKRPTLFNMLINHFKHDPVKMRILTNQANPDGDRPLHWAAEGRLLQVVNTLLAHGANPDEVNDLLEIPLHSATSDSDYDDPEMVDTFIQAGTTLTAQAHDGQTPLHRASINGLIQSAKKLINALKHKPEDLRIPDIFSKSPQDYAEKPDIAQAFVEALTQ